MGEAAATLGAPPWRGFLMITLPMVLPGLIASATLAFLVNFDETVISLFLVGPRLVTLPIALFRYTASRADPPVAALRPVRDDLFAVADARIRIMQLLASAGGQPMERMLPDQPGTSRLQKRSRWTRMFVATLELAKQGGLLMDQDSVFSPIQIRPTEPVQMPG